MWQLVRSCAEPRQFVFVLQTASDGAIHGVRQKWQTDLTFLLVSFIKVQPLGHAISLFGVIGIDIKFAEETGTPYQLLAYAVYPKVALIDNTGDCKLKNNIWKQRLCQDSPMNTSKN